MKLLNSQSECHVLEIETRLEQIEVALDWLRSLAAQHQWPERVAFGLILSADEALTNIVAHSASAQPAEVGRGVSTSVRLVCERQSEALLVRIEDDGPEFDPTQVNPNPLAESIDDATVGGHGVRLMHHYLTSIHYARVGERNVLTLLMGAKAQS